MLMIFMLICLFILIFALFGYIVFNHNAKPSDIGLALFACILLSILSGALIDIICTSSEPTAMDVYKGKTSLEVIYRDGVPVDSVVVFK